MDGKYYWLKLDRNFFKRHDIKIIEAQENGKDYVLFYLKLMLESVDHEGNLRFSEEIPYDEQMLSVITGTNIDIVRSAVHVFCKLGMMSLLDDGTYHMEEVKKLIGAVEKNSTANRVRRYRERLKSAQTEEIQGILDCEESAKALQNVTGVTLHSVTSCNGVTLHGVTKCNESKSKSKSKIYNNIYEQKFAHAWSFYPKKEGKDEAYKAYVKALKDGENEDDIINGIKAYAQSVKNTERRYIKQGSTYFRNRRWKDELTSREADSFVEEMGWNDEN